MWGLTLFLSFFFSLSSGENIIPRANYGLYPLRDNYAPAEKYMSPADKYKAPTSPAGYSVFVPPPPVKLCPVPAPPPAGCVTKPTYTCQADSKYRTIEGECNNLKYPSWGASNTVFKRFLPPAYADGVSEPVGADPNKRPNGYPIPSARRVSNLCLASVDDTRDNTWTQAFPIWAQLGGHDFTLHASGQRSTFAASGSVPAGTSCSSPLVQCQNIEPCFGIPVEASDTKYEIIGPCLPFVRSSPSCEIGALDNYGRCSRQQVNRINSFLDASVIYGQDTDTAIKLRDETTGKLIMGVGAEKEGYSQKPLLPTGLGVRAFCFKRSNQEEHPCYEAGDSRTNENVLITIAHILYAREHNRIADILKKLNPNWIGIKVYEETRRIIAASLQILFYERILPLILGYEGMKMLGPYKGYKSNVNPAISVETDTAAYRFGHNVMFRSAFALPYGYDPNYAVKYYLEDLLSNPDPLAHYNVEPLLRGLVSVRAKQAEPLRVMSEALREHLFEISGDEDPENDRPGSDLAAINIQRGRDHGFQPYVKYVEACGLGVIKEWEDFIRLKLISRYEVLGNLTEVYGTPANIDLFAGGSLEDVVEGGSVGPTFRCLLVESFQSLRDGDRYWYENNQFSPAQLKELKKYTLEHLICVNSEIGQIPRDVFEIRRQLYLVNCNTFRDMDFYHWKENSYGGYQGGSNGYSGGPTPQYNSGLYNGPSQQYGPGPYNGPSQQYVPGPYNSPQQYGPGPYNGPSQQYGPGPYTSPQQSGLGPYTSPQQSGPGPYTSPPQQYGPGPYTSPPQ